MRRSKYTKENLIQLLHQFYGDMGRAPKIAETVSHPYLPRYKVFEYHFGSWKGAVEAAGLSMAGHDDTTHKTTCNRCSSPLKIDRNVFVRSKTKKFYCSRSCSATVNNSGRSPSQETREKVSKKLKAVKQNLKAPRFSDLISGSYTRVYLCTCRYTGRRFYSPKKRKVHPTVYESMSHYRYLCRFQFGLSKFPGWFNLSIIGEVGMYKATNRGNNLTGISRDHMLSVADAYKLNLDPAIVSHPANCQLVSHVDNQRKHSKSCITYMELLNRIEQFNAMYPVI